MPDDPRNELKLTKTELAALDLLIAHAEETGAPLMAGAEAAWVAVAKAVAKEVARAAVAAGVAKAVEKAVGGKVPDSELEKVLSRVRAEITSGSQTQLSLKQLTELRGKITEK